MASNPAFNRIEKDAKDGYAGFGGPGASAAQQSAAAQAATAGMTAQQLQDLYNQPSAGPVDTRRVTMDDVIMKTLALFAIVLVTAAVGWTVAANNPAAGLRALDRRHDRHARLGLVIAFKKTLSVPLILLYAVVEGLFMGAVSQFFNEPSAPGIVGQAVLATLATFAGMFLAYRFGLIKVTAQVPPDHDDDDLRLRDLRDRQLHLRRGHATPRSASAAAGGLGIAISLFAVGLASFTLALDFDSIEGAIRTGAPQKYSWLLAHGLIVTLVWLYIEFLRLFARLRS